MTTATAIVVRAVELPAHRIAELARIDVGVQTEVLPGISYRRLTRFRRTDQFANPIIAGDALNASAREQFHAIQEFPADGLGGLTTVEDHLLFGEHGAILHARDKTLSSGFPVHLGKAFALAIARCFPDAHPPFAENEVVDAPLSLRLGEDRVPLADGILLTQPGIRIYGHWLLDLVSRLNVLRDPRLNREFRGLPIYHFGLPVFAHQFLRLLGIDPEALIQLDPRTVYEAGTLRYPAPLKIGHWVNLDLLGRSLDALRMLAASAAPDPARDVPALRSPPKRVHFSRSRWKFGDQTRLYANRDAMEEFLQANGFVTVHPEEYSLTEMGRLLQNAEVVAGEDGSALHNIVFASRPCTLIVVTPANRINYWHASFCAAMGHRLVFVDAVRDENGAHVIPLDKLAAACSAA